jgi:hypothetical protein
LAVRDIVVSVTPEGRVEARRDDDAIPDGVKRVESFGLDADLTRLFERWLSERDRTWRRDDIATFGRLLHRRLLDGAAGEFIERTLDELGPGERLRLRLTFAVDGPGQFRHLPAVPWEYLHAADRPGRPGFFLATHPRLILCRYIRLEQGQRTLTPKDAPLRLMTIVAQPDDANLGPVIAEPVLGEIDRLTAQLPVVVHTVRDPTMDDLERGLRARKPHILHFMGHGDYDQAQEEGRIALLDDDGGTRWVTDRLFVEILQHSDAIPRLVVLHSCDGGKVDYSANFAGMAPQLVRNGVQCVVAMQYAVTNRVAIEFSKAFYRHLAAGAPVDEAVQEGRWRITRPTNNADDPRLLGVPVIYLHSSDAIIKPAEAAAGPLARDGNL